LHPDPFTLKLLLISGFSSIKVQDERTGTVHLAGSHSVSSACGTFACATGYVVVFVAKYTTAQFSLLKCYNQ